MKLEFYNFLELLKFQKKSIKLSMSSVSVIQINDKFIINNFISIRIDNFQ